MTRLATLAVLAALLVAAAGFTLFPVSVEQQRKNRIQWLALPEFEQQRLREEWAELSDQPPEVQHEIMRRLATLQRLRSHPSQVDEGTRRPDEVERVLKGMAGRLRRLLEPQAQESDEDTALRLRARTRERIDAFLDNLVAADRLDLNERTELGNLAWEEYVRVSLEIQKAEEIYLYSEFSGRREREPAQMETLAPLDLLEEMLEVRRLRGFLGEAGEVLGLSEAEQQQLAEASDEDFFRVAKALMEPKAREYMSRELKMDQDQIERTLARPYRDLERSLHRLVQMRR